MEYLTIQEVTDELQVRSPSQVIRLIRDGRLPAEPVPFPGNVRPFGRTTQQMVSREALEAFKQTYQRKAKNEFTVAETAAILDCCECYVYVLQRRGVLPRPLTREAVMTYWGDREIGTSELARKLGISRQTVYTWRETGRLPAVVRNRDLPHVLQLSHAS